MNFYFIIKCLLRISKKKKRKRKNAFRCPSRATEIHNTMVTGRSKWLDLVLQATDYMLHATRTNGLLLEPEGDGQRVK